MDLPIDLSKVLFVCTANMLNTIPAPLLDRMEVLEVSGYVSDEKKKIARNYLMPQAKKASGLESADVQIEDEAVDGLIQYYCRESGVRNLKKQIEKVGLLLGLNGKPSVAERSLFEHRFTARLPSRSSRRSMTPSLPRPRVRSRRLPPPPLSSPRGLFQKPPCLLPRLI